jgi:hypothetical protein
MNVLFTVAIAGNFATILGNVSTRENLDCGKRAMSRHLGIKEVAF